MTQQHPLSTFRFCPKCGSSNFHERDFKAKQCQDCGFVYYFNSSAAVVMFITDAQGRLLFTERAHDPFKGSWDLPGGFVDMYETGEEAVTREIKEETGLTVEHPRYCFSLPNIYRYSGFDVHTLDLFYEVHLDEVDISHPSDDVARLFLLSKDEIDISRIGLGSIKEGVKRWLAGS